MKAVLPLVAVTALALGGCVPDRAAKPVAESLPQALLGTWRSEQGFVALDQGAVLLRQPGLGEQVLTITAVTPVAGSAAITLADGRVMMVSGGRTLRSREIEGQELLGSCAFIDIHLGTTEVRLWNDEAVTWLPRQRLAVSLPAVAVSATPVSATPVPAAPSAEDRFLAALTPLVDVRWQESGRDLVALARAGTSHAVIAEAVSETERRQRLAALELLALATGPDDARIAVADRLVADLATWRQATGSWIGARP